MMASGVAPEVQWWKDELSGMHAIAAEAEAEAAIAASSADVWERMRLFAADHHLRALELFREFDKDGNGSLDAQELQLALRRLGLELTDVEAEAVIREASGDGPFQYKELLAKLSDRNRRW